MNLKAVLFLTLVMSLVSFHLIGQNNAGYQVPPKDIKDLIEAPQAPLVSVNQTKDWMLLIERPGYPSIEEVAQAELRLAGLRMNPATNGRSRTSTYSGFILKDMATKKDHKIIGLPDEPKIKNVSWSPNGKHIGFILAEADGLALWIIDVDTKKARQLSEPVVNAVMGTTFTWMPDSKTILTKFVFADRGDAPKPSSRPAGPVVQESKGKATTLRTYQDLLKNPFDEQLFEYYASSEVKKIDVASGTISDFGKKGMISSISPSPDGSYVMIKTIKKPFSYLVPYYRFPEDTEIFDPSGASVSVVYEKPLIVELPKGFGSTAPGPRNINWRNDKPASLYWAEALDNGDPKLEVEHRDQLFYLDAPFNGRKKGGIKLKYRFSGVNWGSDNLAVITERWWPTRREIVSLFKPGNTSSRVEIFNRSSDDRYNDPGDFLTSENEYGRNALIVSKDGSKLYLAGGGASSEGDRPFLRAFDIESKEIEELWRSKAPYYEVPVDIMDVEKNTALIRRESKEDPPNYFVKNWKNGKLEPLTDFPHPYPSLKNVKKQVVNFKRADGIDMQGNLYLPDGFKPGQDDPLPVLMWAYPREYKSRASAGQKSGSPYQFIRLSWGTPLYWVLRGYAVFDRVSMPVIGEGDAEPNDSFRGQLVANAEAAINKLVEMEVADRDRIAVGGHSYGAFMTANLLAHSDLFAAGIARSGAYNRTLTPFGFQREERTYWDDPELYYTMSPFMHADKINEPLLMIHGEADNNSGTFPLQSKRMYSAINGLGGKAKLVMLPHESHGYRAKESILHCLYEMDQWVEKYVKNRRKVTP